MTKRLCKLYLSFDIVRQDIRLKKNMKICHPTFCYVKKLLVIEYGPAPGAAWGSVC